MTTAPSPGQAEEPNLETWQRRINESREKLLEIVGMSDANDAELRRLVAEHLEIYREPDRSAQTRNAATSALAAIRRIPEFETNLISDVASANSYMTLAVLSITTDLISGMNDLFLASQQQIADFTRGKIDPAARIAARVIDVQDLTAQNIEVRRATLRAFRNEKLDIGWKDILHRPSADNLASSFEPDVRIVKVTTLLAGVVTELAVDMVQELGIWMKILTIWRLIKKAVGIRKVDTGPDATEAVMKLSERLTVEMEAYRLLREVIQDAIAEIQKLGGMTRPDTAAA